jgi:hypothetical protein
MAQRDRGVFSERSNADAERALMAQADACARDCAAN